MSRLVKDDIVVSIIIPTYHRPVMLRESIQTALKQHYPRQRYEVIVVSDGDPGARSVASEFDEVIYLELPSNRGQSAALNFAFPHARGRYIMIQHDDDRAHPNKLAELATYLDHWPEVGIAFTQANCIDADGNLLEEVTAKKMKRHRRLLGIGFALETELERNSISGASTMYRRHGCAGRRLG